MVDYIDPSGQRWKVEELGRGGVGMGNRDALYVPHTSATLCFRSDGDCRLVEDAPLEWQDRLAELFEESEPVESC